MTHDLQPPLDAIIECAGELLDGDVRLEPEVNVVNVHPTLFERALVNTLEMVASSSSTDAGLLFQARPEDERMIIEITTKGEYVERGSRSGALQVPQGLPLQFSSEESGPTEIGLSIARTLVSAHHGTLDLIEGPRGPGTCLRVILPMALRSDAITATTSRGSAG